MVVDTLKPIETTYSDHRFRSRLEARWALFFDKIKQPWRYEAEGFIVGKTPYLPDFWMPNQDCFIEIKGEFPTFTEEAKASLLSQASGKTVYVFYGPIPTAARYARLGNDESGAVGFSPERTAPDGFLWIRENGEFRIALEGNSADDMLVYAYSAARKARF